MSAPESHAGAEVSVLFVCLGNICRSPTAEGVFRHRLAQHGLSSRVAVDSCGTGGYHRGEPPDARARREARARGMPIDDLRARGLTQRDFARFDYLLAMDRANLDTLKRLAPADFTGRIALLLDFAAEYRGGEIPDPYFGADDGFGRVFELVEAGCAGLIAELCSRFGWRQA